MPHSLVHITHIKKEARALTLEQLEYIVAVDQEGTISAAAQKLNISHPAVSRAISSLESELKLNIFRRSRSGSELTEQGRLVIESARRILREVETLRALSGGAHEPRILQVKAFPIDSMRFIPDVLSSLKLRHGHCTVNITHANVSDIIGDLKTQKIDFGIVALPSAERGALGPELKSRPLFESQFMIACSGRSALSEREVLGAGDIASFPFILHPDPLILRSLRAMFADIGFPDVLTYSNDNTLIKQFVSRGEALSIYTEQLAKNDPQTISGEIVLRPFQCRNALDKVDYLCVYNAKKQLSPEERDFISILLASTAELRATL